jgi:hypothetical protein
MDRAGGLRTPDRTFHAREVFGYVNAEGDREDTGA